MTYFVIPSRRTRQPQTTPRIDWAHPLARELRLLWTGSAARELVGNVALSKTGTVSNIASSSGLGIQAAADSFLSIPTRASLEISADITCLAIVKPVTVSGDASFFAKTTTNGGSNSPFSFNSHNAGLALNRANTGYRVWASGTESLAAGKESAAAVTQGGDIGVAPRFYYNGAFDTAAASSIYGGGASGNAFASGTDVFLCNRNDGSTDYDGSLILAAAWARVLSDAEIATLSANPWQLFAPDSRRIYFGASGGGATTTTIEPGKGFLAVAGYAPGIAQPRTIAPSKGAATLTGYAPGIEQDKSVAPAKGALTLTGYVPTLTQPRTIAAVKGALTLSGYAPGISQSASGTIAPGAGALLLTGHAPGLEQDRNVAPAKGTLTLTGGQPGIVQNVTTFIAPSKGALTLTGQQPSIASTANQVIAPTQGALTLGGYAPVLVQTGAQIIGPIKGALTLTGYAPAIAVIGAGVTIVEPTQGALSLSGYAPLIGLIIAADAPVSSRSLSPDRARLGLSPVVPATPRLG